MNRQQVNVQRRGSTHCHRHGIGNIVQLQIEKDTAWNIRLRRGAYFLYDRRPAAREKLQADLVKPYSPGHGFYQSNRRCCIRNIQREDNFVCC